MNACIFTSIAFASVICLELLLWCMVMVGGSLLEALHIY